MLYLGDIISQLTHNVMQFDVMQECGDTDYVWVYVKETAPDNFDPTKNFTVRRGRRVPAYYRTEHEAAQVVRELGHYIACHEFDEQFQLRGMVVFNPHSAWDATVNP